MTDKAMDSLVERLRYCSKMTADAYLRELSDGSADELTRLIAENARLKGLIEPTEANVERVGRAMAKGGGYSYDKPDVFWNTLATAALTAMGDV